MSRPGTLHSLRTRSGGGFYWVQRYDFLSKLPNDLGKKVLVRIFATNKFFEIMTDYE